MAGREIIKEGSIWCVGDGQRIRVWKDWWIPNLPSRLLHLVEEEQLNMTVSDLFGENNEGWDEKKLADIFPAEVRNRILAIPLPIHRRKDRCMWRHTKNGVYSVRTGFYIASQIRDFQSAATESSAGDLSLWKWIYDMRTLSKIHHFLWKCIKGILPVVVELNKRHIDCDVKCRKCGEEVETMEHCLGDCPWVSFLWQICPLRIRGELAEKGQPLREWFGKIAKVEDPRYQSLFVVILWVIWKHRNLFIYQKKSTTHQMCLDNALNLFQEIHENLERPPLQPKDKDIVQWQKPPAGVWKVNVDAACKDQSGVGIGVVIRDSEGGVLVSRCKKLQLRLTPEVAEGLACQEGIVLAKEYGCSKIILETDCQIIHLLLKAEDEDFTYIGGVCESIRMKVCFFENVIFSWARRTANHMAHALASLASSNSAFSYYTGILPDVVWDFTPGVERDS